MGAAKLSVFAIMHFQAKYSNITYSNERILVSMSLIRCAEYSTYDAKSAGLCHVNSGPDQILCNCKFAYSGLNIQMMVSSFLLQICRQDYASCIPHLLPNTARIIRDATFQL